MTNRNIIQKNWNRIFSAAEEIGEMKPWEWMAETDIFGIRIPDTERLYFMSVMGSAGEVTAISAYMGARALGMFWEIQQISSESLASLVTGSRILLIPHLMLDFTDGKDLEPEKIKRIKSLGARPSKDKQWPVIHQVVPGFVPDEPEGQALDDAAIIFEQCPEIFRNTKEDEDFTNPYEDNDDLYLIRETKEGSESEWQNGFKKVLIEPVEYQTHFSTTDLTRLSGYPIKPSILQIDLAMLPTPVKEGKNKPYFPFILLAVDKKTGLVLDFETLPPLPDIDSMYESVPQIFLRMLLKQDYRPYHIELRSDILTALLSELIDKAGIILSKPGKMKAMDEAVDGLLGHMGGR